MKSKVYSAFQDNAGNSYSFPDYAAFALWFFAFPRRTLVASFAPETFRSLERAATSSREARKPMF